MVKNYFKIAWRNVQRNKLYSAINILGLATGMAVALLIGLWVWDEITFNSYHQNHSSLAQVMVTQTIRNESGTEESMAIPVGDPLRRNYPNDIKYTSYTSWQDHHIIAAGEKKLPDAGRCVQPDFPEMFTLKILQLVAMH